MAALPDNQTNQRDHDGNLMRLRFHEIPAAGLEFSWNQTTGELNEVLADLLGASPVYDANLKLATIENTVQLRGQLSGQIQHQCSLRRRFHDAIQEEFCHSVL